MFAGPRGVGVTLCFFLPAAVAAASDVVLRHHEKDVSANKKTSKSEKAAGT